MKKSIDKIQKSLEKDKSLFLYSDDELQYIKKPLGKAHFNSRKEDSPKENLPKEKNKYSGYVNCNICEKKYTRYNSTAHKKTKHHQFCCKINTKWRKFILDE